VYAIVRGCQYYLLAFFNTINTIIYFITAGIKEVKIFLTLVPLRLYYSDERRDNFTTATDQGRRDAEAAGYRFVRFEGYI
jgi:hypothetical protein